MKYILFLFLAFSFSSIHLSAQNYETGIGLRFGISNGITLKKFVSSEAAIEGIIALRKKGVGFTGLYEKHATAFDVKELQWYYGFGGHVGFWDDHRKYSDPIFSEDAETRAGIDGILGLEYTIEEIPFSISMDYHPFVNLIGYNGLQGTAAVSLRFILK